MTVVDLLPPLVLLSDHNGNWESYLANIYSHFRDDFIHAKPLFRGNRLGLKRHPVEMEKEATFWHLISEGAVEADRTPDMRRCERIRWPRQLIEKEGNWKLPVWSQKRRQENRVAIALPDFSYLLILAHRSSGEDTYFLPWTAFYVEYEHKRNRYRKECKENPFKG